ncbi:MAG: transcription antitermination factor NusB [Sulfuriflexus sp.]|nr:transcription antitermination factor NusB [Sulfuriflexus sp.]
MSNARTKARRNVVQALYQWQLSGGNLADIQAQFLSEYDMKKVDVEYFKELFRQVPLHLHELDDHLLPFLDRPVDEVDPVERAVLRLATYELEFCLDVPYRVVINESVELAKRFGAEHGHKYVNGVVDQVAKKLRAVEMKSADGSKGEA